MKIVLGIISYLPDEPEIRKERLKRVLHLLEQCSRLWQLPIMLIAQNWPIEIELPESCYCYYYDKLGITGARKALRQHFLNSDFDYLIMFDDDMELIEDRRWILQYLSQVEHNPGCALECRNYLLNGFGISRNLFAAYDFDDIDPERGEGFEDWIFVEKLKSTPYYRKFMGRLFAKERKELVEDPYSTWITPETDKKTLTALSARLIGKVHHAAPKEFFC